MAIKRRKQPLENLLYSDLVIYMHIDMIGMIIEDGQLLTLKIIGAAHATEIPLIAGNNKLVGNYGFIIYPKGPSKDLFQKI